MRYRVRDSLVVLALENNLDAAVPVQAGRVIRVLGPDVDDRFVRVRVDRNEFLVFESDLKDHGSFLAAKPSLKDHYLKAS